MLWRRVKCTPAFGQMQMEIWNAWRMKPMQRHNEAKRMQRTVHRLSVHGETRCNEINLAEHRSNRSIQSVRCFALFSTRWRLKWIELFELARAHTHTLSLFLAIVAIVGGHDFHSCDYSRSHTQNPSMISFDNWEWIELALATAAHIDSQRNCSILIGRRKRAKFRGELNRMRSRDEANSVTKRLWFAEHRPLIEPS